jgi:photosystem II stability/assembly factor-like uncharacterized protein
MAQDVKPVPAPKQTPAVRLSNAAPDGLILGAAGAGQRMVTVGDRGVILLSDDQGKTWRQAQEVPTRATLTAVFAVDEKNLWAVGHWGVILKSVDGGEHWSLNHSDLERDQPIFTVWFADAQHGVVAGLFSLLMVTDDAGLTWTSVKLPVASDKVKSDLNLFQLFSARVGNGAGDVWLAAEQGMVYHSADHGHSWDVVATGNIGTFWSGLVLADGALLVGGLEGKMFKSTDHGKTWKLLANELKSSVTSLLLLPNGDVLALALDGISGVSKDGGEHFELRPVLDSRSFTAAVVNDKNQAVLFTEHGIVKN